MAKYILLLSLLYIAYNTPSPSKNINGKKSYDTLPNGKRSLNTLDSSFTMYYKEIVGPDTLLGGYITCYAIDDTAIYFYLRHDDTLHLLNKISSLASPHGLGILEEDFDTYFITRIDNGNSTPFSYQLFDKESGKNILGNGIAAESQLTWKDSLLMLYDNYKINRQADSITLFNVQARKSKRYKLPVDAPEYMVVQLDTITKNSFTIGYDNIFGEMPRQKTYSR